MKKLLTSLFILTIMSIGAYSEEAGTPANETRENVATQQKVAPIEDELLNSECFPKIYPAFIKPNEPITDELAVPYEKSDMTFKIWARKTGERRNATIDDELVNPYFMSKFGGHSILKHDRIRIEDNLAKTHLANRHLDRIKVKNNYDFTQAQIPVQLKIVKNISTKNHILEGDILLFKTVKEVTLREDLVLPKGTQIVGRVETVSESDKMGCPANVVVDNFHVKDNPDICFYGNVTKTGANRSLWVYPLYQAGNITFYVAGFVFVPIHGGHAKLQTKDTFTVFYETGFKAEHKSATTLKN